jgi:hypothetical protein
MQAQSLHGGIASGEEFNQIVEFLLIEKECDGIWFWDFV